MPAAYDVFLSHAWADGERPQQLADALTRAGLRVWFDAAEINDFASITRAVTEGLAKSKALVAYYSKTYPLRRACQWELTAAFLAAQNEGDPRRRVLVINPEQGADHIHPIELRDSKFRNAPSNDGKMQQLVQAIVKHVAVVDGPLADIHPLTAPNWYGMTPVGSTRFVGRLKEMWEVHSLLQAGDVAQITGAAVATGGIGQVQGLGGVGKSLLAEEYALHFGGAYPGGVFWVRAYGNDDSKILARTESNANLPSGSGTEPHRTSRAAAAWVEPGAQAPGSVGDETEPRSGDTLGPEAREALRTDQMRGIAERLGIDAHGMTAEQIEGALKGAIERRGKPCLWVVDDVPNGLDGEALRRWFAPHPLARTLVTTRSREYGSLAKGIDLSVLTPEEALQLLTSRRKPAGEAEEEQARELAKNLGYHALALDVTASALISYAGAEPYSKFRAELANKDEDALELATELADALPNGHEPSIAQTMLRSIRGLGAEGQDFLRLASVLAVAPIPASLVTAVFELGDDLGEALRARFPGVHLFQAKGGRGEAEQRQRRAFRDVTKASLAEIVGEQQEARSVHTLVSRAVRFHEKSAPERTQALRNVAVGALRAEIAKAAGDPRLHKQVEFHVAHARQVVTMPETISEANLVDWVARYDYVRGAYASAQTLWEHALEVLRRGQGPEHPDTLSSMGGLSSALRAQGDFVGARKLQEELLSLCRRVLGLEHPFTLALMNNLALTVKGQGDLMGALKLLEEVRDASRRVLGPEHPDTLQAVNNLAKTLGETGDLAGARKLQEEVLDISRGVLGPEHPNTLGSMHNLAEVLRTQGDLAGARKLHEESLAIRRRVLGPEHPNSLQSAHGLALVLHLQGDWAGGHKLQDETLLIQRRVLGPEHPETLTSMNNLAAMLYREGDLPGAGTLLEDVLAIRRRVLGPEHPETSLSALALFVALYGLGEREAALDGLKRHLPRLVRRLSTLGTEQREIVEKATQLIVPSADDKHPVERAIRGEKVGRNDPCPCGSGKKYKKCHGA